MKQDFLYLRRENKKHFEIITGYKVNQCKVENCTQQCFNYHKLNERRRVPILYPGDKWNYIPKYCENSYCRFGENCFHAHSPFEISFHPLVYKLKLCTNPDKKGFCEKGNYCSFAHGEDDIRVKASRLRSFDRASYKTVKCHSKCNEKECLFYHDLTERRRDERNYQYRGIPCRDAFALYPPDASLCNKGDYCGFSHTKNEVSYHFENYRKKICNNPQCNPTLCTFLHTFNQCGNEGTRFGSRRSQDEENQSYSSWRNQEDSHSNHELGNSENKNQEREESEQPRLKPEKNQNSEKIEKKFQDFEEKVQKPEDKNSKSEKPEEHKTSYLKSPETNSIQSDSKRCVDRIEEVEISQSYNEKKSSRHSECSEAETNRYKIINREIPFDLTENHLVENPELSLNQEQNHNSKKYFCKKCSKVFATYVLGCGKPVCQNCISGPCDCGVSHLTKL